MAVAGRRLAKVHPTTTLVEVGEEGEEEVVVGMLLR